MLEEEYLQAGDLVTGDRLAGARNEGEGASAVERQLGPWRFGEEGVDAIEVSQVRFVERGGERELMRRAGHDVHLSRSESYEDRCATAQVLLR